MNNTKRGWRYGLLVGGLALLALLVMDFNSRMGELRRLAVEQERVRAELEGQKQTMSALQAQIAYATSDSAVREWAYQDGHLVEPGDIPVVPISPGGSPPTPTPTPAPVPTPVSNWQRWLSLFTGP